MDHHAFERELADPEPDAQAATTALHAAYRRVGIVLAHRYEADNAQRIEQLLVEARADLRSVGDALGVDLRSGADDMTVTAAIMFEAKSA